MNQINSFIQNYDPKKNFEEIRFHNIAKGNALDDLNETFRKKVIKKVLKKPDKAPIILIRDLLLTEGEYSVFSWEMDKTFAKLAQCLLDFGGIQYLKEFSKAINSSYDSLKLAENIVLNALDAETLIEEMGRLIKAEKDPKVKEELEKSKKILEIY